LHPPNCSGLRAKYRPRATGSGFFCSGPDLPGLGNRIIVRYASPVPDLQPPELVIIVRFISSWIQCPDLQRSCNRIIVRFTPSCPAYPGIIGAFGSGFFRTIVRGEDNGGLLTSVPWTPNSHPLYLP